jgi:hypothetical protein
MLGQQDPTQRFAYLFDPLDGDEVEKTADDQGDVAEPVAAPTSHRRRRTAWQAKIAIAALIVATGSGTVAIVLLLMRPDAAPIEPSTVTTSIRPTPANPTPPTLPPAPAPAPAPPSVVETPPPPPPEAPAPPPPPVSTAVIPAPPPSPEVTVRPGVEPTLVNPTPATRAPMSVAPETRPAFPNQAPPEGGDRPRGGLLGGGGLL